MSSLLSGKGNDSHKHNRNIILYQESFSWRDIFVKKTMTFVNPEMRGGGGGGGWGWGGGETFSELILL